MQTVVSVLVLAMLMGAVVERLVEWLVGMWISTKYLRYVAVVIAVPICLAYQLDILAALGAVSPWPYIGQILTGLLLAGGSNYIHDFYVRFAFKGSDPAPPPAPVVTPPDPGPVVG